MMSIEYFQWFWIGKRQVRNKKCLYPKRQRHLLWLIAPCLGLEPRTYRLEAQVVLTYISHRRIHNQAYSYGGEHAASARLHPSRATIPLPSSPKRALPNSVVWKPLAVDLPEAGPRSEHCSATASASDAGGPRQRASCWRSCTPSCPVRWGQRRRSSLRSSGWGPSP